MEPIPKLKLEDTEPELTKYQMLAKIVKDFRECFTPGLSQGVIKELFETVPDLDCIQKEARMRVANQLFIKELKPGEVLVHEEDDLKEFYLVTEGTLQIVQVGHRVDIPKAVKYFRRMKRKEMEEKNKLQNDPQNAVEEVPKLASKPEEEAKKYKGRYIAGDLFGDLFIILQKKWRNAKVFALEKTVLITFPTLQINRIIKEVSSKAEYLELQEFLEYIFSGFKMLSTSQQRKILDCFKPVEFLTGQKLIKEGEISDIAYLIKEGECKVFSARNPLSDAVDSNRRSKKKTDLDLRSMRGYMSHTTNTYQFGILEKNQWAGEERILKKEEEPFDYTIEARTNVKAFAISKYEAQKKFPKEFMDFIQKEVQQRYKWIEQRAKSLATASTKVARMDPLSNKYDESLVIISRKFPIASKVVLTNIRKKEMAGKSSLNKKSVFQRGAEMTLASPLKKMDVPSPQISSTKKNSLLPASPEISIPRTERNYSKDSDLLKIQVASSAPHFFSLSPLAPTFNRPLYKSRVGSIGNSPVKPLTLTHQGNIPKPANTTSRFAVGNRHIRLLDPNANNRAHTPNPFHQISARSHASPIS